MCVFGVVFFFACVCVCVVFFCCWFLLQQKMGSDESRFNVSLTVRDKVTKTNSTNCNQFLKKKRKEKKPKRI